MNFNELTKKERRLVLKTLWEVNMALSLGESKATLKDIQSFDYDPTACKEQFRDALNEISKNKMNSDKYLKVKELLK